MEENNQKFNDEVFNTLKGFGFILAIYDKDGKGPIANPQLANYIGATERTSGTKLLFRMPEANSSEYPKLVIYKSDKEPASFDKLLKTLRNLSNSYGNSLTVREFGEDIHPKDLAFVPQGEKEMDNAQSLDEGMSPEQAREILGNRSDWELKNMVRALSFASALNTEEENLRLEAAKAMLGSMKRKVKEDRHSTDRYKFSGDKKNKEHAEKWADKVSKEEEGEKKKKVKEGREYSPQTPYGVRFIMLAGKEGRAVTKELWFKSAESMERGIEKIEAHDHFYEISGRHYPKDNHVSEEVVPFKSARKGYIRIYNSDNHLVKELQGTEDQANSIRHERQGKGDVVFTANGQDASYDSDPYFANNVTKFKANESTIKRAVTPDEKFDRSVDYVNRMADRVDAIEAKLEAQGYTQVKDGESEYTFKWVKQGFPTYLVNYRGSSPSGAPFIKKLDESTPNGDDKKYRAAMKKLGTAAKNTKLPKKEQKKEAKLDESKYEAYGSNKSSYQRNPKAKKARVIIRHSKEVDESSPGARSRNVGRLFVEAASGERRLIESKSLMAARAIANHVIHGGNLFDDCSNKILALSEDIKNLKKMKRKYPVSEDHDNVAIHKILESVTKGMSSIMHKLSTNKYALYVEALDLNPTHVTYADTFYKEKIGEDYDTTPLSRGSVLVAKIQKHFG